MKKTFSFLLILLFFISGCASIENSVFDRNKLNNVKRWKIEFKYLTGETKETMKNNNEQEATVYNKGKTAKEMQLLDDIKFTLMSNYKFKFDDNNFDGVILIHPVTFAGIDYFKSCDIIINDKDSKTIARCRVENGDRNATIKGDYDFAKYCCEGITELFEK